MPDQGTRNKTTAAQGTGEVTSDAETQPGLPFGNEVQLVPGLPMTRYRLGSVIGTGGMGEVLAAADEQIGREVAVKRMRAAKPTERAMARFFREACIQGRLDHPAIVPVHELGVDDAGRPYFTMKRLTGTTLADHIAKHAPRERLLRAFIDICLAVEFAHARGVVHRDIKPNNIVLGEYGDVYILDWGVAKVRTEAEEATRPATESGDSPALTADGAVIGTPGYMAPEQLHNAADVDGRADVYALGCVLHEILLGHRLVPGLRERATEARAQLAPELDAAWFAATDSDRDRRTASARELAERVERFLDGDRDLATRKQLARSHLDIARAAYASADPHEGRRTAMREAGQALALDPSLTGAAELVGRLMLEPPRETPPEVERAMAEDEIVLQENRARAALWGHLGYLPILVMVTVLGAGWYALAVTAALLFNIGLIVYSLRSKRWTTPPLWLVLAGATAVLGSVSCMFSPFLVAPAIAAIFALTAGLGPFVDTRRSMLAVMVVLIATMMVPMGAEWLGILPSTLEVGYGAMTFRPPGIAGPPSFIYGVTIAYVVLLVASSTAIGRMLRGADRGARRQLHLQAWQLGQLVSSRAPSVS